MYIRFVSPQRIGARGYHAGIFWVISDVRDAKDTPAALSHAIKEQSDWFQANLPVPQRRHFNMRAERRRQPLGLCWFRSDAQEMVRRAFLLAALLREGGMYVTPITTARPGAITYRDDFQIVARPNAQTPTQWG